jgi:acetyl esterase/lipase
MKNESLIHSAVLKSLGLDKEKLTKPIIQSKEIKGEWVIPPKYNKDCVILYIHGGAHVFMSPRTHRAITNSIAISSSAKIFVPDYRLCPETPYPGALEDVLNCYIALKNPNMINNASCSLKAFYNPPVDVRVYIVVIRAVLVYHYNY